MDSEGENPEILNLRLEVHDLKVKLSLYENGTSGSDLIEMLEEKDSEIKELEKRMAEREEKIRRLVKNAAQVVKENDALLREKKLFEKQLHKAQEKGRTEGVKASTDKDQELERAMNEIKSLRADNEALTNSIDMLIPETEQFQDQVCELETEQIHSSTDIEKLQKRCVNVVIEMKQNRQELMDRASRAEKELKKSQGLNDRYHEEVLKAQKFNGDLKEKLSCYKERIKFLEQSQAAKVTAKPSKKIIKGNTSPGMEETTEPLKGKSTPGRQKRTTGPFTSTYTTQSVFASGEVM